MVEEGWVGTSTTSGEDRILEIVGVDGLGVAVAVGSGVGVDVGLDAADWVNCA